jgi:hypothetical protein
VSSSALPREVSVEKSVDLTECRIPGFQTVTRSGVKKARVALAAAMTLVA